MNTFLHKSALVGLFLSGAVWAQTEPTNTGWALYVDNDLFAPGHHDRDYTGGLALTMSGASAQHALWSPEPLRAVLGKSLGWASPEQQGQFSRHGLETAMTVFTPGEIHDVAAQKGDRPYASLISVSASELQVLPEQNTSYMSTLTIGVLGAPLVASIQEDLHQALGSEEPNGWDKQISHGGELTARYSLARTQRSWQGQIFGQATEITTAVRASIGYLTELTAGVATRSGSLQTPWWSYNPQLADYAERSVPVAANEGNAAEHYFWAGASVHLRVYNAFLQGQFRDSANTFSSDELHPLIAEGWVGYTQAYASHWRVSYMLRAQTSEIRSGPGDRALVWGGIIVSQAF